jgi:hypothetical protein
MRSLGFAGGILVGFVLAGVTFWALGASRRERERRLVIDGARPLPKAVYDARPQELGAPSHLASEIPDVPAESQRW